MLKYLSGLRHCPDVMDALNLAGELKISTLFAGPSPETKASDLVLSLSSLVPPQPSSFLMPGTCFIGLQKASHDQPAVMLNRDRDYLRRMVANRNLNASSTNLPGSITAITDAERIMTDLIEDYSLSRPSASNNSTGRTGISRSEVLGARGPASRQAQPQVPQSDSWPVRVTLHSVSLDLSEPHGMTVTGTMYAEHIPDKLSPSSPDHKPEGSSMESFFEGEIIDFSKHTLETGNQKYKSGGIEVDASHWRGVGPFRIIQDKVKERHRRARLERQALSRATIGNIEEEDQDSIDRQEEEIDGEIERCLSRTEWIENNLTKEWILMRWKGKCSFYLFFTTVWQLWLMHSILFRTLLCLPTSRFVHRFLVNSTIDLITPVCCPPQWVLWPDNIWFLLHCTAPG